MNYRDLVFLEVAQQLSFSRAAESLFISQPAVSKHIQELESSLNAKLFDRKNNVISLTQAGEIVFQYLKQIKKQYEVMEFELGRLSQAFSGVLRIGASTTISQYFLPKFLVEFSKQYPEIKLSVISGNTAYMESLLTKNEIDIALVENQSSKSGLAYNNFFRDRLLVVCSKNSLYAKKHSLTVNQLQTAPMLLREKGSGTLQVIYNELASKGVEVDKLNVVIRLGSTESIKRFLPHFNGIAFLSKGSIEKELFEKEFITIETPNLVFERNFRYATLQGYQYKPATLFINKLKAYNF